MVRISLIALGISSRCEAYFVFGVGIPVRADILYLKRIYRRRNAYRVQTLRSECGGAQPSCRAAELQEQLRTDHGTLQHR